MPHEEFYHRNKSLLLNVTVSYRESILLIVKLQCGQCDQQKTWKIRDFFMSDPLMRIRLNFRKIIFKFQ